MKLHVDLETFELIEGPGFRNPVTSLRFKRGDAAKLEVVFLRDGTTPVAIGDPTSLEMRFGVKPRNRYDVGYLVHTADWTMPAPEAENPVYQCSPSFNTEELNSALNLGSATATEISEITLMGEITWREGSAEPTSTRTFLVIVENDVNRGDEGVPESAEPPYPAPQNIASPADLAAVMAAHLNAADPHPNYLRHDVQESLSAAHQGNVRAAINAPEAPPDLSVPMQNIGGTWYPAVLDFAPSNSQTGDWSTVLLGFNGAFIRVIDPYYSHQYVSFMVPPISDAGVYVVSSGSAINIELATDSGGAADTTYGGPNSLSAIASAIDSLGVGLVIEYTGDANEPVAGTADPFSNLITEGTPGWRGRLAAFEGEAWICTKDDMTTANDGWRKLNFEIIEEPYPPSVVQVTLDSYENWTSFGSVEAGANYHVRFDNFTAIPESSDYFGIGYVNYGSGDLSNVQLVSNNYLDASISEYADFAAALSGSPASASDIYAEFTFTADATFDWAGYSYFGMYASGYQIGFTVTLTRLS